MIKIDKNLLEIYLSIESKKATDYLNGLADDIKKEIFVAENNEDVIEGLEILEKFVYKASKQAIEIARHVIDNPIDQKKINSPMGEFNGKSYKDVIIKILEILNHIRYINPDGIIPLLKELISKEDKGIKEKAIDVLRHFSKYDFNVLTKSNIGYGAQRKILDYVLAWPIEERINNFDFIKATIEELLNSSVEGTTSGINEDAQYTITLHSGVVDPNDFVKKIRREAIDLVVSIYKNTDDERMRLKIVDILDEAMRGPISVAYGENVEKMIVDDTKYLMSVFRGMLFDEKGNLIGSISVAEAIESRLYWFNKNNDKISSPESKKLREDILADTFYSLFHLFAGDDIVFRQEEGHDAEVERKREIDEKIKEINESNLSEWTDIIDKIAKQVGLVEEWQFRSFNGFLRKLSIEKSDISFSILSHLISSDKLAKNVLMSFLDGFRDSGRLDIWDEAVEKILEKKDVFLTSAIIYSLDVNRGGAGTDQKLRESDLSLIESVINQSGKFSFLEEKEESNLILQHATINALIDNLKNDYAHTEPLLIEAIKKSKEKSFLVREIDFGFHKNGINCGDLSGELNELLKGLFVEIGDLDWNAQELLLNMGHQDVKIVFDIFWKRMEKDTEREKTESREDRYTNRYQAIPYHFNDDLKNYISSHEQFQSLTKEWIDNISTSFSKYNFDISRFLKAMGGPATAILKDMIESGSEENITKAVLLIDRFEGSDIETAIEVVRKTKDDKNISHVGSMLFSTGVVSGEDGIARAFEAKAETLKKYFNDENEQVRRFAEKMVKDLEDSAKRERQNNEEEKQLRKIEFNE